MLEVEGAESDAGVGAPEDLPQEIQSNALTIC